MPDVMAMMMQNRFAFFLTHRKVLLGVAVATAVLWTINRIGDRRDMQQRDVEEDEEQVMIDRLKQKLPARVLRRYGLSK
jgi:hypothetical protein